jgi:hypothetical protein
MKGGKFLNPQNKQHDCSCWRIQTLQAKRAEKLDFGVKVGYGGGGKWHAWF